MPSLILPSLSLLPSLAPSLLAMSQSLNPSHFLSLQKHHYTSQREGERWGGGGAGGEEGAQRGCRESKSGQRCCWDEISKNQQMMKTLIKHSRATANTNNKYKHLTTEADTINLPVLLISGFSSLI